jgi:hypothetical protein
MDGVHQLFRPKDDIGQLSAADHVHIERLDHRRDRIDGLARISPDRQSIRRPSNFKEYQRAVTL